MSVNAIPPTLTDDVTLFIDRAAAQAYFNKFAVPDSTTSSSGVASQAGKVTYNDTALNPSYETILFADGNGGNTSITVPSKVAYDALQAKYDNLSTQFALLVANMKTAGLLES